MMPPDQIRVLLADDQEFIREGNALLLDSTDDITVIGESRSGEEAIALTKTLHPDIVVMDVRMPGMGGIEATRHISAHYRHTRIIVLTTFDIDEYAFGGLDAGASAFVLKSSSPETLINAIRTVASGEAVVEPRITKQLIDLYTRRITPGPKSTTDTHRDISLLSPRETEVLYAIAQGLSNPEISEHLFLSPATVKSHINHIFAKLDFRDRAQAIIYAHRNGLANAEDR